MLVGPSSKSRASLWSWAEVWEAQDIDFITSGPDPKNESAKKFVEKLYHKGLVKRLANPWDMIDPYKFMWEGKEVLNPRAINALLGHFPTPHRDFEIDFDQMWQTPERIYYQENAKSRTSIDLPLGFETNAPYEIARFFTPEQRIGVVRTMETSLTFYDDALRWPKGDGLWMTRYNVACTWYLRIEPYDPTHPLDPYNYRGPIVLPVQIPGVAWRDLPQWVEMRFLWGDYCPVYFIVPPASLLSLWISFEVGSAMTDVREIAGRFTGYTQAQANDRARRNVTTGW
jgi:hypothetical protein